MDIKRDVQQQFGKNAGSYIVSKIHKEGKDLKKLIEIAALNGNERVLDIATGGGHTANAFAPFVEWVTALDLTPEMLAEAEKFIKGNGYENVEFIEGDAENLPFPDEMFEIVTSRIAPHHFPNVNTFVKEVNRVLKQGGQFLLVDNVCPEKEEFDHFFNTVEKMRDYSHFRAWKKTEWIEMLELSGFEIQELYRFEKTFMFDSWCERMKLPLAEKESLNTFMLAAGDSVKKKFRIMSENNKAVSFAGESFILKAFKV